MRTNKARRSLSIIILGVEVLILSLLGLVISLQELFINSSYVALGFVFLAFMGLLISLPLIWLGNLKSASKFIKGIIESPWPQS